MGPVSWSTWRPLTIADVLTLTTLVGEVEQADRYGWHFDAAFLARWLDDPLIDLDGGSIAAFDGERMGAMGVLSARSAADPVHRMRYEGSVHPVYRGRGLGAAILSWAVHAAPRLSSDHFPGHPLEVLCAIKEFDVPAAALFSGHGFTPVRWLRTMTRSVDGPDLPPVLVPAGIEIVPYGLAREDSADLDEQVRVAKIVAFREHWGVTPTRPQMWRTLFVGPEFQPDLSPLALDAATGEIVGLVITHLRTAETAATGRRDAHVNNVGTLPQARGRGIGSALMATMVLAAHEHGFDTSSLAVDSANATGALSLYDKAGFVVTGTWVTYARAF